MNETIKINVTDLSEQFIEELRAKYGRAELEIKVVRKGEEEVLSEVAFWDIIDLLDWNHDGEDQMVVEPAVQYLSSLPVSFIYQFQDKLAQKLYLLDTKAHAENTGNENAYEESKYFSVDIFLYARCCVVANGREFFEQVLRDPSIMPKDLTFEKLLYVASDAYERKTGQPMEYLPAFSYETFSNADGWVP